MLDEESYSYDAAGNITDAPESCFEYDTNNRLVSFGGNAVSYDLDGNMLSATLDCCTSVNFAYDSANRLVSAGDHSYTYNAEDVRIRNLYAGQDTTYTYDTNCRLSKLLCKTTNNVTTKYVYGHGLIGEETINTNSFKTYHFDCRGSTIAITNASGTVIDTFEYDTYGKLINHTGPSDVIFGYNGRDGVVTDENGFIYMRARYYSPDMRRFINADIVAGSISEAVTLNRYAYANGNPVSFVDPFGLAAERAAMMSNLSNYDIAVGITVVKIGDKYYYDYSKVVMDRLNAVLPDFYNHDILTFEEYVKKYSVKLFGKWVISTPTYGDYWGTVLGNLWFFYDQVNHNAPWDIKRDTPWKQQFGDVRMPYYDGDPHNSEEFVFRNELVTREDLGNITYGYLGSAMGIGDITLYWGGGVAAQGLDKILSDDVRDASKNYGDTPEDHMAIKKGIELYYEDYPAAEPGINRVLP